MGTDNSIQPCYLTQAQDMLRKHTQDSNVTPSEQTASLFDVVGKDGKKPDISVEELASLLQRGCTNTNRAEKLEENTDIGMSSTAVTSSCTFAKDNPILFLLSEAKKYSPDKYEQIKARLSTGTFTINTLVEVGYGHSSNLLKHEKDGFPISGAINTVFEDYNELANLVKKFAPNSEIRKIFFDKLAEGQLPSWTLGKPKNIIFGERLENEGRLTTFNFDDAKLISTQSFPLPQIRQNLPLEASFDKDPMEKKAAAKICKNFLSPEQVQEYDKHILEMIKDEEGFSMFLKTLGKNIGKTLKVNPSQTFGDPGYRPKINQVSILPAKNYIDRKEGHEYNGHSPQEIKRWLIKEIFYTTSHEYYHAAQKASTKKPPKNANAKQRAIIAEYKQNYDHLENYMLPGESVKLYGSTSGYANQAIEKSALEMSLDVAACVDDSYAKINQGKTN